MSEAHPLPPVTMTYTNWKGVTSERTIIPRKVWFGRTEWHPELQWLVTAWDVDKSAERDFALADFGRASQAAPAPSALVKALRTAEAALSDIGDAEREEGDDLAWCEGRAAKALPLIRSVLRAALITTPAPSDGLREAVEAERERIAVALEAEADLLPCAEDAAVTRSNAALIRADFSYEDADRAALSASPAQEGGE